MLKTLRQAIDLIGRDQRGRWVMLIGLALLVSGFEALGAALVYVLIGLVADPAGEIDLPIVGDVRSLIGNPDDRTLLLGLIAGMALFFLLRAPAQVGSVYVQKRVAENSGARLSNRLVEGYLSLPYQAHLRRNSAEFVRNGQQAVQQLVSQVFVPVIRVAAEGFLTVAMLILLLLVAPAATVVAVLVVGGVAGVLLLVVQPRLKALGRTAHAMQRETLRTLQESLHGLRDIKILGREHYFARRYVHTRLRLARSAYLRDTWYEVPRVAIELALIGVILLYFAVTIVTGESAVSALPVLGLFAYAGLRLLPSAQKIIAGLNSVRFSAAPLEDLHNDLETIEAIGFQARRVEPLPFTEALILDDVAFRYEGTESEVLKSVDLTIRPGEQIGICGPTGGGKTTLLDLITCLVEPTSGRITVDGQGLSENARAWQRNLGVVSQSIFLIDDTLRRNIAFGVPDSEIDDEAVAESIELAQLEEFVGSLPKGLDSTVGEKGIRISGGERQRIAIARALYRRPAVLIFDEGTSSLDNATEAQLMAAIERLRGRHTIILVAHRLSTVRMSDRLIFIDQGRVSGQGPFDVLKRENERFRALTQVS